MQPPRQLQLRSVTQAAAHVGVTAKTIRAYIERGLLTGYRVGPRLVRIDQAELDALIRPMGERP